jgi:hypothetical protein
MVSGCTARAPIFVIRSARTNGVSGLVYTKKQAAGTAGAPITAEAACPAGKRVIGGDLSTPWYLEAWAACASVL